MTNSNVAKGRLCLPGANPERLGEIDFGAGVELTALYVLVNDFFVIDPGFDAILGDAETNVIPAIVLEGHVLRRHIL